jgi:dihydropteroate synthase
MTLYLLSDTRLRIRGTSDRSLKKAAILWREIAGSITAGPAGSTDFIGQSLSQFQLFAEKIGKDQTLLPIAGLLQKRLDGVEKRYWEIPLPAGATGLSPLRIGERPLIMGIINVTPDSFSDGGVHFDHDSAVDGALKMIDDGADILDVGGESTRPGSAPVDADEERRRVLPVIERLVGRAKIPISIDTRKSEVARAALESGAAIVNDVTMLTHDPKIADVAADAGAPLILSHIRGTPATMQQSPHYEDMWPEIIDALEASMNEAVRRGVHSGSIILDPGIGFGKALVHNLTILNGLFALTSLGRPVLVGPSRKRFIGDVLGVDTDERLEGTIAACVVALMRGASIFRVHDVRENRLALDLAHAILKEGQKDL